MVHVATLWMRFASEEEADETGKKYCCCPKVHFWANKGDEAYIILKVPDDNKFWSDYIRDNPKNTFGGEEAQLVYLEKEYSPSLEISYEKVEGITAPCGACCTTCPAFGTCTGCPALNLDTL